MGGCFQCPFVSIFFCNPLEDPHTFWVGWLHLLSWLTTMRNLGWTTKKKKKKTKKSSNDKNEDLTPFSDRQTTHQWIREPVHQGKDFWKMIFWLVFIKLEISYRVMISWRILVYFRGFFWRLYFCMVKYLNFHNSSFALRYLLFNVNGKATVWHTPCFIVFYFING